MKKIYLTLVMLFVMLLNLSAQTTEEQGGGCTTPNLDSAQAIALPYYDNNQMIENYLQQNGYNNLPYISFPSSLPAQRTTSTSFLEPNFLIPINIYIYRDGGNNPNSSISEIQAREFICSVNEIYRNAGTAIQFYTNRVEIEANNFFNQELSTNSHVYDLWSRKRLISDNSKGINVHFIRYNNPPEDGSGKASLPHYPVLPFTSYSCYVRTHENPSGAQRSATYIAATLAHEIGHTLALLHTHHPGRLPSLVFNEENGTIANGCYQESVSRAKKNYWYNGCINTDNKLKCEINGDFLCDTKADPNQTGRVLNCTYIYPSSGNFREDNWGDLWNPPTHNVMSYTTGDCRNEFSKHQIGIMWMQIPDLKQSVQYQNPTITSSTSDYICTGSTRTFSLSGTLPNDATITWEAQPSSLFTISSGTGNANLTAASSTSRGQAKIIYTLIGPGNCYIARIQKTIWVGKPFVSGKLIGSSSNIDQYLGYGSTVNKVCNMKTFATIMDISGEATLQWQRTVANPTNTLWNQYGDNISSYFFQVGQTATFRLTTTNSCGSTAYDYSFKSVSCSSDGDPCNQYSISPNPSNFEVNIVVPNIPSPCPGSTITNFDSEKSESQLVIKTIDLYNPKGEVVLSRQYNLNTKNAKLDLTGLQKGIYILKVSDGQYSETHRLIIRD